MTDTARPPIASHAARGYLQLSTARGIGPIILRRLLERFGSPPAILDASEAALQDVDGVGPETARAIRAARNNEECERELTLAAKHNARVICPEDDEYPAALRQMPDPPICLYIKGRLQPEDARAVAVVGARKCTHYGREQSRRFGYALAERGVTVVSGLARGIDGAAHWGAIEANGRTIAVLGNGLAHIYPPEHDKLAARILDGHGALISELPMETAPDSNNFLPRNRLIAGLALGTVIVEAARRSGALSTAKWTSEYDRELFAVPGRVDSVFSDGTNALIRDQHAKLVMHVKDVLDELEHAAIPLMPHDDLFAGADDTPPKLSGDERRVYEALSDAQQSLESLCATIDLPIAQINVALTTLQLKRLVTQLPGAVFMRAAKG
jgi:DNA processing protein